MVCSPQVFCTGLPIQVIQSNRVGCPIVLRDLGMIDNDEPATRMFTQGMVIKNGAKMSKSKGNVVSPDDMIARYGADATRVYALFAAPPDRGRTLRLTQLPILDQ